MIKSKAYNFVSRDLKYLDASKFKYYWVPIHRIKFITLKARPKTLKSDERIDVTQVETESGGFYVMGTPEEFMKELSLRQNQRMI